MRRNRSLRLSHCQRLQKLATTGLRASALPLAAESSPLAALHSTGDLLLWRIGGSVLFQRLVNRERLGFGHCLGFAQRRRRDTTDCAAFARGCSSHEVRKPKVLHPVKFLPLGAELAFPNA